MYQYKAVYNFKKLYRTKEFFNLSYLFLKVFDGLQLLSIVYIVECFLFIYFIENDRSLLVNFN